MMTTEILTNSSLHNCTITSVPLFDLSSHSATSRNAEKVDLFFKIITSAVHSNTLKTIIKHLQILNKVVNSTCY